MQVRKRSSSRAKKDDDYEMCVPKVSFNEMGPNVETTVQEDEMHPCVKGILWIIIGVLVTFCITGFVIAVDNGPQRLGKPPFIRVMKVDSTIVPIDDTHHHNLTTLEEIRLPFLYSSNVHLRADITFRMTETLECGIYSNENKLVSSSKRILYDTQYSTSLYGTTHWDHDNPSTYQIGCKRVFDGDKPRSYDTKPGIAVYSYVLTATPFS